MRSGDVIRGYTLHGKIGQGSFGGVYCCSSSSSSSSSSSPSSPSSATPLVMKVIDVSSFEPHERESCLTEVKVLAALALRECPYIVEYVTSFIDAASLCMVMEYAEGGTLQQLIRSSGNGLQKTVFWKLAGQLCIALHAVHSERILHRDLKTANVFLTRNCDIRLGDFGLARILSNPASLAKSVVGTPFYLSPEMCGGEEYSQKSDVWALGVIVHEMCTARHPFAAGNQAALVMQILQSELNPTTLQEIEAGYGPHARRVIVQCLSRSVAVRPEMADIIASDALYDAVAAACSITSTALSHAVSPKKLCTPSTPPTDPTPRLPKMPANTESYRNRVCDAIRCHPVAASASIVVPPPKTPSPTDEQKDQETTETLLDAREKPTEEQRQGTVHTEIAKVEQQSKPLPDEKGEQIQAAMLQREEQSHITPLHTPDQKERRQIEGLQKAGHCRRAQGREEKSEVTAGTPESAVTEKPRSSPMERNRAKGSPQAERTQKDRLRHSPEQGCSPLLARQKDKSEKPPEKQKEAKPFCSPKEKAEGKQFCSPQRSAAPIVSQYSKEVEQQRLQHGSGLPPSRRVRRGAPQGSRVGRGAVRTHMRAAAAAAAAPPCGGTPAGSGVAASKYRNKKARQCDINMVQNLPELPADIPFSFPIYENSAENSGENDEEDTHRTVSWCIKGQEGCHEMSGIVHSEVAGEEEEEVMQSEEGGVEGLFLRKGALQGEVAAVVAELREVGCDQAMFTKIASSMDGTEHTETPYDVQDLPPESIRIMRLVYRKLLLDAELQGVVEAEDELAWDYT